MNRGSRRLIVFLGLYVLALALIHASTPGGVQRRAVSITTPNGEICPGTLWSRDPRDPPKAVAVIGHGVTSNQGVMATTAKAFAADGYAAVTIDFAGHGRSRARFNWLDNWVQVLAWCDWARAQFPGLPVVYLGHSMGGFAGAEAFAQRPAADAFVAMGALPDRPLDVKTLVSMGRFEELFNPGTARAQVAGWGEVLVSPYSDHSLEPCDFVLLGGIVAWADDRLGLARTPEDTAFVLRWAMALLGVLAGTAGALGLATLVTSFLPRRACICAVSASVSARRFSLNPYRVIGRLFGYRGRGRPPRSGTLWFALAKGIVFSGVFVALLAWMLDGHLFSAWPSHPERSLEWVILIPLLGLPVTLSAMALERLPLPGAAGRFAVAALTKSLPLIVLGVVLGLAGPGWSFAGMMLGLFTFILVMLSGVYALATRAAADYRAGIAACAVSLAWVLAYWFPLTWGW